MKTKWSGTVNENNAWREYPRPQLVRREWQCLNGKWLYKITPVGSDKPHGFDGEILVPFAIESELSGVGKRVSEKELLWYKKDFVLDDSFQGKKALLHFDAVDWKCDVFLNGTHLGTHEGGYTPFCFDISGSVKTDASNELILRVWDPTDSGMQPRGKQASKSHGFWYTSTTGIWQSVWLEPVNDIYIKKLRLTPDIDEEIIKIKTAFDSDAKIFAEITENNRTVFSGEISKDCAVRINNAHLWSPEDPFLYGLKLRLEDSEGNIKDEVESYFGMRKFSIGKDRYSHPRLLLNNRPYFQRGLLDQGYFSDGGLTPPCDEAMINDIRTMKELGFNMLRKHIKAEPARWYYHCDKIGMIVWQDMISGIDNLNLLTVSVLPFVGASKLNDSNYRLFGRGAKSPRREFVKELFEMIDHLSSFTSIACWVIFNEGWGQFDALRLAKAVKRYDPSRWVDHASGWHDRGGPDFLSVHKYILPVKEPPKDPRPFVLSEYGGLSYMIPEHSYNPKKSFGYNLNYKTRLQLSKAYEKLHEEQIIPLIKKGLCATVYTQLSDVEFETNGIFTYDRAMIKPEKETIRKINEKMVYGEDI